MACESLKTPDRGESLSPSAHRNAISYHRKELIGAICLRSTGTKFINRLGHSKAESRWRATYLQRPSSSNRARASGRGLVVVIKRSGSHRARHLRLDAPTVAVRYGDGEIVKALLENGADANAITACGHSVLYIAVDSGRADMVKLLLEKGADPTVITTFCRTLLHTAAERRGHDDILKLLLESELDPNAREQDRSWAPIHIAAGAGSEGMVRLLLDKGANPNVTEDEEWTSLHIAVDRGRDDVVKLLLQRGADPKLENGRRDTPLQLAVRKEDKSMVRTLLGNGVAATLGPGRCTAVEWLQGQQVPDLHGPARCLRP